MTARRAVSRFPVGTRGFVALPTVEGLLARS
jgi:hypothetical protein